MNQRVDQLIKELQTDLKSSECWSESKREKLATLYTWFKMETTKPDKISKHQRRR